MHALYTICFATTYSIPPSFFMASTTLVHVHVKAIQLFGNAVNKSKSQVSNGVFCCPSLSLQFMGVVATVRFPTLRQDRSPVPSRYICGLWHLCLSDGFFSHVPHESNGPSCCCCKAKSYLPVFSFHESTFSYCHGRFDVVSRHGNRNVP